MSIEIEAYPRRLSSALRVGVAGGVLEHLDRDLLRLLSARIEHAVSDRVRYRFDAPYGTSGTQQEFTDWWKRRTLGGAKGNRVVLYNNSPQAGWLTGGTGVFGPRNRPITATNKKAMAFWWYKIGEWVMVKSVKGVNPESIGSKRYNMHKELHTILADEVRAFMRDDVPSEIRKSWYGNK